MNTLQVKAVRASTLTTLAELPFLYIVFAPLVAGHAGRVPRDARSTTDPQRAPALRT